ncbi:MAG: hypothetical protein ACTSQ1_11420 [Promethearchaeota archaeon]
MRFDENTVSKRQQKLAQKFIDSVLEGFRLKQPPKYVVKGLNSDEEIAKLEFQKFEKNEKEIKKLDRKIKDINNYVENYVKVIFEFDKNPKRLTCMSDIMKTSKAFTSRYIWSGVLDFPVSSSILFGRVCKIRRHGGGDYYFSPFENLKSKITDNLEKLEAKAPDLFPYKVIESNPFIELLGNFKFTMEFQDQLKQMPKVINSNLKTTPLVDALNQKNELIKIMKKIPHFGTTEYLTSKFVSEVDISTLLIPYKGVTYFHIDHFSSAPKKEYRAIDALLQSLEQFNN